MRNISTLCFRAALLLALATQPLSAHAQAADAISVQGLYDATTSVWKDTLAISADGKFRRGAGHSGTWTFDGTTLKLAWSSGKPALLKLNAAGAFADPVLSISKRPAPAWLAGSYDAVATGSAAWRDVITLAADGTLTRANGELGRWTFDGKTLALHWSNRPYEVTTYKAEGSFVIKGLTLAKRSGPPPVVAATFTSADVPGTYDAAHPHWGDALIINEDGTYQRGNGDPGRWTFDGTTLILSWTNWGPEAVKLASPGRFDNGTGFTLVKRGAPVAQASVEDPAYLCGLPPTEESTGSESAITAERHAVRAPGSTVKVCYLSSFAHNFSTVRAHADRWSQFANIKFDFYGPCQNGVVSDIRIGTDTTQSSHYYMASRACSQGQACSANMNLTTDSRRTVLHEFGHALGLAHEHMNPKVKIPWDLAKLQADGKPVDQYTKTMLPTWSSALDPYSIMFYKIDYKYIIGGKKAWLAAYPGFPLEQHNSDLSDADKTYIASLYPASGPRETTFDSNPTTVTFYQHVNYGGASRTFSTNIQNMSSVDFTAPSSLKMVGITEIAAYEHKDFGGSCITLRGDQSAFPGQWNDVISSFKVNANCGEGAVVLFDDRGYRGASATFDSDTPNVAHMENRTSSIMVRPGVTVAVFSEHNYRGICNTFTGNIENLRDHTVGNDTISSIFVNRECPGKQGELYKDKAWSGARFDINNDVANLRDVGFNDEATAVVVSTSSPMAAYEDINFGGRCITLRSNIYNLKDNGFNDKISSIRVRWTCEGGATP